MSTLDSLSRSSGSDNRIVWEVTYGYTAHDHHESSGGGEWTTQRRAQNVVHLIAPTYALAKALYELKYGYGDNTLAEIMPLCTINDEMDLTRGWRA